MNRKICICILINLIGIMPFLASSEVLYDQKYVSVGVLSNESLPQFTQNANIRFLGNFDISTLLNKGGQITLDKLFNLNNPSIIELYRQGFSQATKEEQEIAEKDISADPRIILESEGAVQLIKNNYIVIINKEWKERKQRKSLSGLIQLELEKQLKPDKTIWSVYHVEIDDEVINQVFYNWGNPSKLKQIQVPIKLIATGTTKKINNLVYDISKKVGNFAIRGPITSSHPCIAEMTSVQGVKQGDQVKAFQTFEDEHGNLFSRKIADGRVLKTGNKNTNIKIISGRYPSLKKGDIAAIVGRGDWSVNIEGEYSFGGDWRAGGKLWFDRRFYYTNKGVSWYVLWGLGIDQYNKEPLEIWYETDSFEGHSVQPSLRTYSTYFGLCMGYSFLTKFEIIPYFTLGFGFSALTKNCYMWNGAIQSFEKPDPMLTIPLSGGVKLAVNICYPFQLILGANYNIHLDAFGTIYNVLDNSSYHESVSVKPQSLLNVLHDINRLNFTLGFRYNF